MNTRRRRLPAVFYLAIILAVVGLNWLLFRFFGSNYFLWYLKNGTLISLATAFLAPTWTRLRARLGLISAHPAIYFGACLQVMGVYILSHTPAPSKESAKVEPETLNDIGDTSLVKLFDNVLYVPIVIVMCVLSFAWVILVAPLSYFVTLIAGVPARQAIRGRTLRTVVSETGGQVAVTQMTPNQTAPKPSFAQDPFAVTQALTSLVLFVANMLYARLA